MMRDTAEVLTARESFPRPSSYVSSVVSKHQYGALILRAVRTNPTPLLPSLSAVASSTNPLSGIDPEAEGKEKAMAKGKSFDAILADAEKLIRVWTANPKLSLGDVSLPAV